jgi:hypothetical protein
MAEEKIVKNVLLDWELLTDRMAPTIRGKVLIDQPLAGVKRGEDIRTSEVIRIYTVEEFDGSKSRFAETRNSLYQLVG